MYGLLFDHPICDLLGEEVWALEVNGNQAIKAFLGSFEDILSNPGGNPGIVDQDVEPAETVFYFTDQAMTIVAG